MAVYLMTGAILLGRLFLEIHSASPRMVGPFLHRHLLRGKLSESNLPGLTFIIQKRSFTPNAQWDSHRIQAVLVGRWHGKCVGSFKTYRIRTR